MRVYIGPYKNGFGSYQIAKTILFWKNEDTDKGYESVDKLYNALEKIGVGKVCVWINKKFDRKIKVKIHNYDTWGMDNTLAYIILPMLKQLKATKHGSPYVDQDDLPVELRLTKREQKVFDEGHWNKKLKATEEEIDAVSKKFHSQFDWIMDQMIWSFEQELDEEEGRKSYYDPYLPGEVVEPPMKHHIIKHDGEVVETDSPFTWDTEEWRRKMGKYNKDKHKIYADRKQLGFTLFGKYYQSLWD
jgi:hypothetical protein